MTENLNPDVQKRISPKTSVYVSRAYNYFTNVPFGLVKKGSFSMKLADEIMYYKTIERHDEQKIFFPRVYESYIGKYNWIILEKYAYDNLANFMMNDRDDESIHRLTWDSELKGLRTLLAKFATWEDPQTLHNEINARKMYIEKTEREFEAFRDSRDDLEKVFFYGELTINGQKYLNFHRLWEPIKQFITDHLLDYHSVMIHGDFCLSNILFAQDKSVSLFRLIDPRGSFGRIGIYGDQRYDIAKLMHSIDGGYEFFIYDHYRLRQDGPEFEIKYFQDKQKTIIMNEFEKLFFPRFSKKEITVIQGLIFIGMCRRHYDNKQRQLAMFCTGVKLLNEALNLEYDANTHSL